LTGENTILKEKLTNYQDAEKSWNKSKAQLQKQIDDLKSNSLKALIFLILDKISAWKK
jgi:uncharacterized UPF0160 family protein